MTYYQSQVIAIRDQYLPAPAVTARVIVARQLMDAHLGEAVDLDFIARKALLSKFHLIRLFRRCYGHTPYQYLTEARIRKAKQLLRARHSISDTCYQTGFQSIPSFTALFKKHTGLSPAAYREKGNFQ